MSFNGTMVGLRVADVRAVQRERRGPRAACVQPLVRASWEREEGKGEEGLGFAGFILPIYAFSRQIRLDG